MPPRMITTQLSTCVSFPPGCLNQERKLETLRKKEVDNTSKYLAKKEDRMKKKRDKNEQTDNGHTTKQDSPLEQMAEKRRRLEK